MTKKTLKLRSPSEQTGGPPVVARTVSPERLDRLHDMARANKRHPTDAQKALWAQLADQKHGGFKFKRQAIVGNTLVDFACPARWLVIEITAGTNDEFNAMKDRKLNDMGIRVMRYSESQVMGEMGALLEETLAELLKPFTKPQPVRRAVTRPVQFAEQNDMPIYGEGEEPVSDAVNALLALCTAEDLESDAEAFGANYVHIFDAAMPDAIREAGEGDDALLFWSTEANDRRRAEEGFADQASNVAIAFPVKDAPADVADVAVDAPSAQPFEDTPTTPPEGEVGTPDTDLEETEPSDA
ncbi:endonuclease domain-containing protein [Sphingomonadaceae bacterium]|nr:endonuclease domain-containing protein [Sphingomonadaceae bacterium]